MNPDDLLKALYANSPDDDKSRVGVSMITYEELEIILEALQTYLVASAYENQLDEIEAIKFLIKKILYSMSMFNQTKLN